MQTPLIYDQWWHVAGTLDGASGNLSLYTNGALAAQTNTALRPFGPLIASESPGIGIGNVNDGGNMFPFQGDIDEVSLYNRALSAPEVLAIYNADFVGKCRVPPSILTQPADQTVNAGTNVSLNVVAAGSPNFVQLDYIFCTHDIEVLDAGVIEESVPLNRAERDRLPSDHLFIRATIDPFGVTD